MSGGARGGMGGRLALFAAGLMAALALTACGGSPALPSGKPTANGTLNTPRVALAIQQSILSERHIHATVVCPPKIPQEKGFTFTCVATTLTGHGHHPVHTIFTVSQTDSAGHVYYQSPR